jgi:ABC-type sugar transport system ATPase subunit
MVIEPRVLLFDEPLSNLDAKLRVEMREEIRAVQKELGITAVYVTHDQEEALVISDRIAVVSAGRIQQVGAPWSVYKDPVNLFVASFVGKVNLLDAELGEPAGEGFRKARTGSLELIVNAPHGYAGKKVKLAFRPEDAVEGGGAGAWNTVEGGLVSASFLGAVASLEMDCGGSRIVVERHRPKAGDLPPVGSRFSFALPPDAILLFDPESGTRLRGVSGPGVA